MNEEQAGNSRTGELNGVEKVAAKVMAHTALLRAFVLTHPDRDRLRSVFDQLIDQHLQQPAIAAHPEIAAALHASTEVLFRPEMRQSDQP